MLLVAEAVARAALARRESRGAHQREDFPALDKEWSVNQMLRLDGERIAIERVLVTDETPAEAVP